MKPSTLIGVLIYIVAWSIFSIALQGFGKYCFDLVVCFKAMIISDMKVFCDRVVDTPRLTVFGVQRMNNTQHQWALFSQGLQ